MDLAALMDMPLKLDKIGCNDVRAYFSFLFNLHPIFPSFVNFQQPFCRAILQDPRLASPDIGENWRDALELVKLRLSRENENSRDRTLITQETAVLIERGVKASISDS